MFATLLAATAFAQTTIPSSLINWVTAPSAPSQTAKYVFAAPNGAAGVPTFRQLVASDIPTLAPLSGTLAQFAATTSAQLAAVISDETGSGSLVFGTGATIGTAAINTPTISGGTINNAAIGGTTPAAGAFTTLKGNSLAKVFATNTSGQSIPNTTSTTITGWTTVRDANSNFVASTGVFTAPTTADYLVCVQLVTNGVGVNNGVLDMSIIANGSAWAVANSPVAATTVTDNTVSGCADVFVSAAQTITINLLQNSGSAQPLATTAKQLYLSIVQLP
ncbi:hypothetical protein [Paraburkholderia sp. BL6665CI2N2]|uniref:hypothetical protein n=1 Tax=Paraburkholderia sp. BL6665CI2N2 TaxID=1938806 RepID=UPI001064826B|nr:hypothetical protein [Paraburkholderia sp. BL6665CI2N2]